MAGRLFVSSVMISRTFKRKLAREILLGWEGNDDYQGRLSYPKCPSLAPSGCQALYGFMSAFGVRAAVY
jgi:hypothetical protein